MTPEITRTFGIDMGHRLQQHESKCAHVHGHRYAIEVSCRGLSRLDSVGRVIDFSVLKEKVGAWLEDVFDHGFCAEAGDPIVEWLEANGQKHVCLDVPPTVEHLVEVWFHGAAEIMAPFGIVVTRVKAYETPSCFAEYTVADARNRKS